MKTLILYFSFHHKNTERIAKAMAEVLNADLVEVTEASPEIVFDYDLIGFWFRYLRFFPSYLAF